MSQTKTKKIRIAGYCTDEQFEKLMNWCEANGKSQSGGIAAILQTMLVTEDDSQESLINLEICRLEAQIQQFKSALSAV